MTRNLAPQAVHRPEEEIKHVYTETRASAVSSTDGDDTTRTHSGPPDLALSQVYKLCLEAFRLTCHASNPSSSFLHRAISESSMRDELARFTLWGEEIEMVVIDQALEPADFLVQRVILHLFEIGTLILKGMTGTFHNESITALRSVLEEISKSETLTEKADLKGEISEDEGSEDDMADIPEDIGFRTRCLLELTPTIQGCIDRVEESKFPATAAKETTVSDPAYHFVRIVQEKYTEAPTKLVKRLGEASWQRHDRLRRLANDHKGFDDATIVAGHKSLFHDFDIGTNETAGTNYPISVKSHSYFMPSNATGERIGLEVPPVPVEVKSGRPFSCSLCGQVQFKIKNRVDWKTHVFNDLRPYMCTFEDCLENSCQFNSRTAWADHEFSKHRHQPIWQCLMCQQSCSDIEVCKIHLEEAHDIDKKDLADSLANLVASTVQARPINLEECFICMEKGAKSKRAFLKHVCRHMEEIALMALPKTEDCNGNDSVDTEDSSDSEHPAQKSYPSTSLTSAPLLSFKDEQNADRSLLEDGFDPEDLNETNLENFFTQNSSIQQKAAKVIVQKYENSRGALQAPLPNIEQQLPSTWSPQNDDLLVRLRNQGNGWSSIAQTHFPDKRPDFCRTRYEKIVEAKETIDTSGTDALANEDWTKISDQAERHRIQNRIAQRNYRRKIKRRLKDLEARARDSSSPHSDENIDQGSYAQPDLDPESGFNGANDLDSKRDLSPVPQVGLQDNLVDNEGIKNPQRWDYNCCDRQFSTFSDLLRHYREQSHVASEQICEKCGAKLTCRTNLDEHLARDICCN